MNGGLEVQGISGLGNPDNDKFGTLYHRKWCEQHPDKWKKIQARWRDKNPDYYANYIRERKGVSDALIFQFFDNGFGKGDGNEALEGFITFLLGEGVSEQHIGWFKVDVRKELEKREKREKGFKPQITRICTDETGVGW